MSAPWIAAFLVLWLVVLLSLFLQIGQMRRTAEVLEQAETRLRTAGWSPGSMGVELGSKVPEFEAEDADGTAFTSGSQLGRKTIYLFLAGDCDPCMSLVEDMTEHGGWGVSDVDLIAVMEDEGAGLAAPVGASRVVVHARTVAEAFGTTATPHAFAAGEGGIVVEKSIPNTLEELRTLAVRLAARDPDRAGGVRGR